MNAPPLVSLIDVLFVILLFLMLVADFEPREQEPVRLPEGVSSRECWSGVRGTPLPINIHHREDRTCPSFNKGHPCGLDEHWTITIHGRECTDPTSLRAVLEQEVVCGDLGGACPRNRRIDVRSDARAPCGLAQRAMNACALLGIQRVHASVRRFVRD